MWPEWGREPALLPLLPWLPPIPLLWSRPERTSSSDSIFCQSRQSFSPTVGSISCKTQSNKVLLALGIASYPGHSLISTYVRKMGRPGRSGDVIGCGYVSPPTHLHNKHCHGFRHVGNYVGEWAEICYITRLTTSSQSFAHTLKNIGYKATLDIHKYTEQFQPHRQAT